jgi:hypothetical protein
MLFCACQVMLTKAEERELRTLQPKGLYMHTVRHNSTLCCAHAVFYSCQVMLTKAEERQLRTLRPKNLPHAYH